MKRRRYSVPGKMAGAVAIPLVVEKMGPVTVLFEVMLAGELVAFDLPGDTCDYELTIRGEVYTDGRAPLSTLAMLLPVDVYPADNVRLRMFAIGDPVVVRPFAIFSAPPREQS